MLQLALVSAGIKEAGRERKQGKSMRFNVNRLNRVMPAGHFRQIKIGTCRVAILRVWFDPYYLPSYISSHCLGLG